jgi:hypothetical protein
MLHALYEREIQTDFIAVRGKKSGLEGAYRT